MIFPYSRFGRRTEAGITELTALTDALEKFKPPENAGKTWTLTRREAVILARTARTSLERAGRF
ncbi:hypothetical protein JCM15519_14680 [Fundidesulfovibrio butyratiphilus]